MVFVEIVHLISNDWIHVKMCISAVDIFIYLKKNHLIRFRPFVFCFNVMVNNRAMLEVVPIP